MNDIFRTVVSILQIISIPKFVPKACGIILLSTSRRPLVSSPPPHLPHGSRRTQNRPQLSERRGPIPAGTSYCVLHILNNFKLRTEPRYMLKSNGLFLE